MQRIADLPAVSAARVLELKQEAAALKQQLGIKQTAALARIAQREGFQSWERLVAHAGGADAVQAAKPESADHAQRRAERQRRFGEPA